MCNSSTYGPGGALHGASSRGTYSTLIAVSCPSCVWIEPVRPLLLYKLGSNGLPGTLHTQIGELTALLRDLLCRCPHQTLHAHLA